MRVYVDTNILIDYVCQRQEFADAANRLLALGYMGKVSYTGIGRHILNE